MIKHFIPIVAICIVCGLATFVGSEALAAGRPGCNDSRGSILARQARVMCKSLTRRAVAEHPRWTYHAYTECRGVSSTRAWCTWEIEWNSHGASCSGDASVVGTAHPRVHYGKETCVA